MSNKIANSENNWKEFEFNFDELNDEINTKDLKNSVIKIRKLRFPENFDKEIAPLSPLEFENFNWSEKSQLSKEEIKKLEKLSKQRAELAKKQAELAKQQAEQGKKQAEIAKQQAEISRKFAQNHSWIISGPEPPKPEVYVIPPTLDEDKIVTYGNKFILKNTDGKTVYYNSRKPETNVIPENSKIYLNGKPTTKKELENIDPEKINSVSIFQKDIDGVRTPEIRIQTK